MGRGTASGPARTGRGARVEWSRNHAPKLCALAPNWATDRLRLQQHAIARARQPELAQGHLGVLEDSPLRTAGDDRLQQGCGGLQPLLLVRGTIAADRGYVSHARRGREWGAAPATGHRVSAG